MQYFLVKTDLCRPDVPTLIICVQLQFYNVPLLSISDEPPLDFLFTATDLIQVKHVNMA